MAIEVIALVLPADPNIIRATVKLVAIKLASHAHKDGTQAWPSVGSIGYELGVSERHVQNALRELKSAGVIRVQRSADARRRLPTVYAFNMDFLQKIKRSYRFDGRDIQLAGARYSAETTPRAGGLPHPVPGSDAPGAPKSSLNHTLNLKKSPTKPTGYDPKRILKELRALLKEAQGTDPNWADISRRAMAVARKTDPTSPEYFAALELAGTADNELRRQRDQN
jgi:biotin operon repressor